MTQLACLLEKKCLQVPFFLQDFDFPEASNKIKSTSDGRYLIATGTYKPRMKVFELDELAMKFDRVTDSENIDFCVCLIVAIYTCSYLNKLLIKFTFYDSRFFPPIGQRQYICKPTELSTCTPRQPHSIAYEPPNTAGPWLTISLHAMRSVVGRAQSFGA